MKKVIAIILCAVMLLPLLSFGAAADSEEAEKMQLALLAVKEKISVPEELSEFSSNVTTEKEKRYYSFEWADKKGGKSIYLQCDDKGRIISYGDYAHDYSDKKISSVSKKEIIAFAESFLRQTAKEAFKDERDTLSYDEKSYNAGNNLRYSLTFKRYRDSFPVINNFAEITVAVADNKPYVKSLNMNYDYDALFESETSETENLKEAYMKAFPAELIYIEKYDDSRKEEKTELVYRIKDGSAGYISLETGKEIKETEEEIFFSKNEATADMGGGVSGSSKADLSEKEIAQLGEIEGLLTQNDILKKIKELPYIEFSDALKNQNSSLIKREDGEYFYRLNYESAEKENYRYFSAVANARDGKIVSISNYFADDEGRQKTATNKKDAQSKITAFLKKALPDEMGEFEKETEKQAANKLYVTYVRKVNGIKYIDNTVNITFDTDKNRVERFGVKFSKTDFQNPEKAIGENAAYEKIIEYSPIEKVYVKNGEAYVKAARIEKSNIKIDAFDASVKNADNANENEYTYSDIKNHWVEEAAQKLAEIRVGIKGGVLKAESEITQSEYLRLTASGLMNNYYGETDEEELYERLISNKILSEEEKNPAASITREDAFIYMIRIAGLEKAAKLKNIYKTCFADESMLSEGKIGYAALLCGLGVICGNENRIRPKDNLTRAEAVTMVYRYLIS